jgi:hypothetical protein
LEDEKVADFLQQVAQLNGQKIDEQFLRYYIKINGALAIAQIPCKLYFNNKLSACGINVFTLVKRHSS